MIEFIASIPTPSAAAISRYFLPDGSTVITSRAIYQSFGFSRRATDPRPTFRHDPMGRANCVPRIRYTDTIPHATTHRFRV
jgi:hypothetical protein